MAINYTEKGAGLFDAIIAAGHFLVQRDGVWSSDNDAAVQAIIDAYDPLPDLKAAKAQAIKDEGIARINGRFPWIANLDAIHWYAAFWQSIAPAARQATPDFQFVIDVYTAAAAAIATVNGYTAAASVQAFDVQTMVAWP